MFDKILNILLLSIYKLIFYELNILKLAAFYNQRSKFVVK